MRIRCLGSIDQHLAFFMVLLLGVGWAVEAVGCVGGEAATRRGTTSPGITDHLRIIGMK